MDLESDGFGLNLLEDLALVRTLEVARMFLVPVSLAFVTEFILACTEDKVASQGFLHRFLAMRALLGILFDPCLTALLLLGDIRPVRRLFTTTRLMRLLSTFEAKPCPAPNTKHSFRQTARIFETILTISSRAIGQGFIILNIINDDIPQILVLVVDHLQHSAM